MGVYQHIYIGPYVQCTYRKTTEEVVVKGCTNSECPEYKKRSEFLILRTRPVLRFRAAARSVPPR